MFICPPYLGAQPNFRVRALIHEVSHYYGSVDHKDYGYGSDAAKEVAIKDPDLVVTLAENYSFFVDNIPHLS